VHTNGGVTTKTIWYIVLYRSKNYTGTTTRKLHKK